MECLAPSPPTRTEARRHCAPPGSCFHPHVKWPRVAKSREHPNGLPTMPEKWRWPRAHSHFPPLRRAELSSWKQPRARGFRALSVLNCRIARCASADQCHRWGLPVYLAQGAQLNRFIAWVDLQPSSTSARHRVIPNVGIGSTCLRRCGDQGRWERPEAPKWGPTAYCLTVASPPASSVGPREGLGQCRSPRRPGTHRPCS